MTLSREKPPASRWGAPWAPRPAAAFTLVEVLVVLGLLVLLAGISWPVLESQITASELPESADRLCSALFMARSEAVLENRRYRIRFTEEAQQPLIERESDPIRFPGVFEPVTAAWAAEPILLSDVQVHHVVLGQPAWTKPLSRVDDAAALKQEQKELEEEDDSTKRERQRLLRGLTVDDAEGEEETRPAIVFESDGSAEWATLVLSRLTPEDKLEETTPQLWVVLDGRTGLARVRQMITEEQLSDPEFYVEWEKLDLPDTVDISDLSFDIGEEQMAGGESDLDSEVPGGDEQGNPQDPNDLLAGGGEGSDSTMMGNQPQQRPRRQFNDLGPGGGQQPRQGGGDGGGRGVDRPPPRRQGGDGSGQPGDRPRRGGGGGGSGGQGGGGPTETGSRQDGTRGGQPRDRGNMTEQERKNLDEWVRQNR